MLKIDQITGTRIYIREFRGKLSLWSVSAFMGTYLRSSHFHVFFVISSLPLFTYVQSRFYSVFSLSC